MQCKEKIYLCNLDLTEEEKSKCKKDKLKQTCLDETSQNPKFLKAIKKTLQFEGGYVNNPKDPGMETNFGITKKYYPDLNIKELTIKEAGEIYFHDYWLKNNLHIIQNATIAGKLFDIAVNSGFGSMIRILRKSTQSMLFPNQSNNQELSTQCYLHIYGRINTLQNVDCKNLFEEIKNFRRNYYLALTKRNNKLNIFLKGWLRRNDSFIW
ncbi:glycoside hydrolase family 108 protein [Candidatus Nesciobacter abundans]|uniref:TtsA-like Glycoside hydrolase family 108 domain-containing protein n=1 Tax=Candidatus Nesciobacter abundans TaxID=2601668 RepID=A0A5C0UKC6_9PROT|nr:glycosyl hydrolase 108 family protein [Candidatus Nesciobacter abundans]QEK39314.1 hypothetical protein FZC36_02685 [Candidatus Nesciobacter abundans]